MSASSVRPCAEPIESRVLLSVTQIGELAGGVRLENQSTTPLNAEIREYEFTLTTSAVVDVEVFNISSVLIASDLQVRLFNQTTDEFLAFGTPGTAEPVHLQESVPAGTFRVTVGSPLIVSVGFAVAIAADRAPGQFSGGGSNVLTTQGRNLGALSTASGVDLTELVGFSPPIQDALDVHFFDLVKQGTVQVTVDIGVNNDSFIDFAVFRDSDADGVFERGTVEQLATRTDIGSGANSASVSLTLPAARYGIVVIPASGNPTLAGFSNYRLRTTYTVADDAGNTLAAARNAGTVGNATVTFNDYVSSNDSVDIYKFTTVAGGPFAFVGALSGMATGSNFELDFIRDLDADGAIDANEVITSDRAGNVNEDLNVPYTAAGTFFVRVRRTAGEGIYTLAFSNRNTDLAGNTVATALNFGALFGLKVLNDQVSSADTDDFYKFTLDAQAEFDALLGSMPAGTNANLSLLQSNGTVIASSNNANNASERITRNLTAGTYFVRVSRVSGSPSYSLRLVKDSVGDSLAGATSISATGGGKIDFVGPEDATDVYKFTLATARLVGVSVGLNNEPLLVRLGQDTNGNGVLDGSELRLNKTLAAGAGELQRVNLPAGTYILQVNAVIQDEGTTYGVTVFNEKADNAGNTLADAKNLGTLSNLITIIDFVGDGSIDLMDDLDDFYRFTLGNNGAFRFNAQFSNLTGNADLQLIRDDNLNGVIDSGEILGTTSVTGTGFDSLNVTLLTPGTHYLRVFRTSGQADYGLLVSAPSNDTAGNSLVAALNLGTLGTVNSLNHFVGAIDRDDFFKFSINAPGELLAVISSADNPLRVDVIRNADNDATIDPGEILATSEGFIGLNDRLNGVFLPVAGDYFVRVFSEGGDSTYSLGVQRSNQTPFLGTPFQVSATGTTTIQAEAFDNGGEDVAYNDTTTGNDNGASRANENVDVKTTSDSGGGFRIATTAVGEFLEYTINVASSAVYDFDFRVSSPDTGAAFHVEIDDVNVTGTVTVPDTGGFDDMVTVTDPLITLTSGPHILRFAFDTDTGNNNGFAGSLNFIRIRPTQSTGTFLLKPALTEVKPAKRTTVSLAWTVPLGGWRALKEIQLRLRDERGTTLWLRFDEASNTFRLYNNTTNQFGTPKAPGSAGVLSSGGITLHLAGSSVNANGPTDTTVVLKLDFSFATSLAGRHFTVEAAASDDRGRADPFKLAGRINVKA